MINVCIAFRLFWTIVWSIHHRKGMMLTLQYVLCTNQLNIRQLWYLLLVHLVCHLTQGFVLFQHDVSYDEVLKQKSNNVPSTAFKLKIRNFNCYDQLTT